MTCAKIHFDEIHAKRPPLEQIISVYGLTTDPANQLKYRDKRQQYWFIRCKPFLPQTVVLLSTLCYHKFDDPGVLFRSKIKDDSSLTVKMM